MLRSFLPFLFLTVAALAAEVASTPQAVIVFGDSIAAGSALPASDRQQAWTLIAERESHGAIKVINESKGGRPTNSVAEFEAMLTRQPRADLLVLALGTNDSRDITDACVPKAVANLQKMIERARTAYGPTLAVLLVGPPNINKTALGPTKPIANEREAKLRELGEAYATLAKELTCDYVSLFGTIPDPSLTKDGVHPDAAGNEPIARTLLPKLIRKQ